MDKTLELLIKNIQKVCPEKITISKCARGYIFTKRNFNMLCKTKELLILELVADVFGQGKEKHQQELKRVLGL